MGCRSSKVDITPQLHKLTIKNGNINAEFLPSKLPETSKYFPHHHSLLPTKPENVSRHPSKLPTTPENASHRPSKLSTMSENVLRHPSKLPTTPENAPHHPSKLPTGPKNASHHPSKLPITPEYLSRHPPKVPTTSDHPPGNNKRNKKQEATNSDSADMRTLAAVDDSEKAAVEANSTVSHSCITSTNDLVKKRKKMKVSHSTKKQGDDVGNTQEDQQQRKTSANNCVDLRKTVVKDEKRKESISSKDSMTENSTSENEIQLNICRNCGCTMSSTVDVTNPTTKVKPNTSSESLNSGASSQSLTIPLLPDKDLCRFKNKKAVDVIIPYVLRRIYQWGCPDKQPNETPLQYMRRKHISSRKIHQWEIQKLNSATNCEQFDVSVLYSLIRLVCSGLASFSDNVWKLDDGDSIECLLTKAKEFRNGVMHDITTVATSEETLNQIGETMEKLIRKAGELYSLEDQVIEDELAIVTLMIKDMKELAMTDREKQLIKIQRKLCIDGKEEMRRYWEKCCLSENMYFSNYRVPLSLVYHPITLSAKEKNTNIATKQTIKKLVKPNEILGRPPDDDFLCNMIILEGSAGSGKTTLLKMIVQNYLQIVPNQIDTLAEYDLVHYMQCRERSMYNFQEYIRSTYPQLIQSVDIDDIVDAIHGSKNLFLFDGVDELNEQCLQMLIGLVEKARQGCPSTFILTTRPYFTKNIQRKLDSMLCDHRTLTMEEISEGDEQMEFLQRYEKALISNENMVGLSNGFETLDRKLISHFVRPINIVLFCHLYEQSPGDVIRKWTHECDIYRGILEKYKTMIYDRFKHKRIVNLGILVDELLDEICDLSMRCVQRNKMTLTDEDCDDFYRKCYHKLDAKQLPVQDALSTVFFQRTTQSVRDRRIMQTYESYYIEIHEYLASKALLHKVKEQNKQPIQLMLEELVGEPVLRTDLHKYMNVFAYTIVQLTGPEKEYLLKQHIRNLAKLLEESGQDEFSYWSGVLEKCHYSDNIVREAAQVVEVGEWKVYPHTLEAAVSLLRYKQPRQIIVEIPENVEEPPALNRLLAAITCSGYAGGLRMDLWHSYCNCKPIDEVLEGLRGSRCTLWRFTGCVGGKGGSLLAPLMTKLTTLAVAVMCPAKHDLHLLPAKNLAILEVAIKYTDKTRPPSNPRPLPNTAMGLSVRDVPTGAGAWLLQLLTALAPRSRGLAEVLLLRCGLHDAELAALLTLLPLKDKMQGNTATEGWTVVRVNEDQTRHIALFEGNNSPS